MFYTILNNRIIHLESQNLTYWKHMKQSLYYCYLSTIASLSFFIHAIFPCVFEYTGSFLIYKLYDNMDSN